MTIFEVWAKIIFTHRYCFPLIMIGSFTREDTTVGGFPRQWSFAPFLGAKTPQNNLFLPFPEFGKGIGGMGSLR
jgi:hypothetical protein